MKNIVATAHELRAVRQACQMFLTLWEIEHYRKTESLLERVAVDVERYVEAPSDRGCAASDDWKVLPRLILDD